MFIPKQQVKEVSTYRMLRAILVLVACMVVQQVKGDSSAGEAYEKNLHAIKNLCAKYNCPEYTVMTKAKVRLSPPIIFCCDT